MSGLCDKEWEAMLASPYAPHFTRNQRERFDYAHHEEFNSLGWLSLYPQTFTCNDSVRYDPIESQNITTANYTVPPKSSFISKSIMEVQIPKIKLKDEFKFNYRFRLTDDVGYKIFKTAVLKSGESTVIQTLDPHSQIILLTN